MRSPITVSHLPVKCTSNFKEYKSHNYMVSGLRAYISASESFELRVAIPRVAVISNHGYSRLAPPLKSILGEGRCTVHTIRLQLRPSPW